MYVCMYVYNICIYIYIPIECSQVPTAIALDLADTQADDPAKSRVTLDVTGFFFTTAQEQEGNGVNSLLNICYIYIITRNAWALPRRSLEVSHSQTNGNDVETLPAFGKYN